MSEETRKKPFALDDNRAKRTSFTLKDLQVRDQDNAKPVPPPPAMFRLDHPRLAPPGMKGVRPMTYKMGRNQDMNISVNLDLRVEDIQTWKPKTSTPSLPKDRLRLGDQGKVKWAFRAIAQKHCGRSQEH
ncbi:MAG: hypothetical protein KDE25_04280 [Novosphingobium sp.]|nr:hypothetical protein [Novosphingobium sp.]